MDSITLQKGLWIVQTSNILKEFILYLKNDEPTKSSHMI